MDRQKRVLFEWVKIGVLSLVFAPGGAPHAQEVKKMHDDDTGTKVIHRCLCLFY
jgi:hypothetical protein